MQNVWTIALHEYRVNLRRPGYIFFTLLVPGLGLVFLLVGAFFGQQAGGLLIEAFDQGTQRSAFVDQSGSFTSILPQYQEEFLRYGDESLARAALEEESVGRVIVVPPSYLDTGEVVVLTRNTRFTGSETRGLRSFFMAHLVQGVDDETLRDRLVNPYDAQIELIYDSEGPAGVGAARVLNFIVPFLFSILLTISIFSSTGYLLRSISEEKSSRVIEIVLSSVTPQQLLAGKVLGQGALGLTQIIVWVASAWSLGGGLFILAGIALPFFTQVEVWALSFVFYILGFTVYAVLIGSIGTLGANTQESQQIAGIFTAIVALPMMLSWVIMENPNAMFVRVLSWFPLTAPTTMMLRLPLAELPEVDLAASILLLLATVPVVIWLGGKMFRVGMLMYGKRPGLLEIVRLLRTG